MNGATKWSCINSELLVPLLPSEQPVKTINVNKTKYKRQNLIFNYSPPFDLQNAYKSKGMFFYIILIRTNTFN